MKLKIEEIFDQLLDEMAGGQDIAETIKKYPEYEDDLKELLKLAKEFKKLSRIEPDEMAIARTVAKAKEVFFMREKIPFIKRFFILQPALIRALAIFILIIILGGAGLLFSSKSMPGDVLYPAKRFSERIQYSLTHSIEGKVMLHIRFADHRAKELVYAFNKDKKIDEVLLKTMLGETENAYNYSQSLNEDRALIMLKRIAEINEAQIEVLKAIKQNACACDTNLINYALKICNQRCQCLDSRLHSKDIKSPCPYCGDSCTCW